MYSGRLSLVGDLLQGLFREAYALQKCLMELLDKISLDNSASEEEISDIVTGAILTPSLLLHFLQNVLCNALNASLDLLVRFLGIGL